MARPSVPATPAAPAAGASPRRRAARTRIDDEHRQLAELLRSLAGVFGELTRFSISGALAHVTRFHLTGV